MEIDVDLYRDGFLTKEINCIDIPLAACCGTIDRNNYFYYLFILSIMNNFSNVNESWFGLRNYILRKMKGDIIKVEIEGPQDYFDKLISEIKLNHVVLCIFKYGSLPYSRYYKTGTYDHGVILCGIDEKKELVKICDRELVRRYIEEGIFEADVLASQWISYYMLKNMIVESFKIYTENRDNLSEHYKCFYVIKQLNRNEWEYIKKAIVIDIKDNFNNNIVIFLKNLRNDKLKKTESFLQNSRRDYYLSLTVIKKILARYEGDESNLVKRWDEFLLIRLNLINLIYKNYYSGNDYSDVMNLIRKDKEVVLSFFELLGETNG